jgi:RNA polymerase-binding transcription factor DksA
MTARAGWSPSKLRAKGRKGEDVTSAPARRGGWKKALTAAQHAELRAGLEEDLRREPLARRRGLQLLDALRRLEAGTYGVCHGCRLPISYVRLSVIPETTVCVDCSAAREAAIRA